MDIETQREAIERANGRDDYWISVGGMATGPYSQARARRRRDEALASGARNVQVLHVVEDYEP
jgi:hypothetical protein